MSGHVVVGELTLQSAKDALQGRKADIVYSDPPWGTGNLKYWRTQNGEPGTCVSWPDFLNVLGKVTWEYAQPNAHIFLEMGCRFVDELADVMRHYGFKESSRWTCLYGSPKRPNVLWYSGPGATCDPTGLSGVTMTHHVLSHVASPGAMVLDPCCGRGMTAKCAMRLGMDFAGIELSPKRAAVTAEWIRKLEKA